jgi:hypothetical protein
VLDGKLAWVEAPNGELQRLLAAAEATGAPIRDAWFGERVSLLLSLTSVPDFETKVRLLINAGAQQVRCDVAAVSAVAVGVGRQPARLASALACVPQSALATSVSPLRLTAVVPSSDAPALERAWHALFA